MMITSAALSAQRDDLLEKARQRDQASLTPAHDMAEAALREESARAGDLQPPSQAFRDRDREDGLLAREPRRDLAHADEAAAADHLRTARRLRSGDDDDDQDGDDYPDASVDVGGKADDELAEPDLGKDLLGECGHDGEDDEKDQGPGEAAAKQALPGHAPHSPGNAEPPRSAIPATLGGSHRVETVGGARIEHVDLQRSQPTRRTTLATAGGAPLGSSFWSHRGEVVPGAMDQAAASASIPLPGGPAGRPVRPEDFVTASTGTGARLGITPKRPGSGRGCEWPPGGGQ
jgi:hypothetical protein